MFVRTLLHLNMVKPYPEREREREREREKERERERERVLWEISEN